VRVTHYTSHCFPFHVLTLTDGTRGYAVSVCFVRTIRNNINIEFSSREALYIFTHFGVGPPGCVTEQAAHLDSVRGTSSLNGWPDPVKCTNHRPINKIRFREARDRSVQL
jgi:hypothetical protein